MQSEGRGGSPAAGRRSAAQHGKPCMTLCWRSIDRIVACAALHTASGRAPHRLKRSRTMLSGTRTQAPQLAWRAALAALGHDGAAGGLTTAAPTGWRQAGAGVPAAVSWPAGLHTSAPRRSQEEAAASTAAEVAGSGLHFTPDASAAGGALVGLAGTSAVAGGCYRQSCCCHHPALSKQDLAACKHSLQF